MSALQRATLALLLGVSLTSAACGDDATPRAQPEPEQDGSAAAVGATAGPDAASGTDSGTALATDAGGSSTDAGTSAANASDAGGASGADAATVDASEAGTASDAGPPSDVGAGSAAFALTSPAFENAAGCAKDMASACKVFPEENVSYMKDAASELENVSPELNWTGVPAGTKSFAVVLQDLTNGMAHWVLWNISGSATKLEKNVAKSSASPALPAGSQQCNAGFAAGNGYFGPGSRCNVYEFVVYALSAPMFSPTPATDAGQVRTQLQALAGGILATASLRGRANYMMMCRD
jgi:Raf kinase inhibitor-like YbhB/YbcL family protein